ncbi:hypothetical protein DL93DRAFT_2075954, partial [Clavulina sp. PMI_390]
MRLTLADDDGSAPSSLERKIKSLLTVGVRTTFKCHLGVWETVLVRNEDLPLVCACAPGQGGRLRMSPSAIGHFKLLSATEWVPGGGPV